MVAPRSPHNAPPPASASAVPNIDLFGLRSRNRAERSINILLGKNIPSESKTQAEASAKLAASDSSRLVSSSPSSSSFCSGTPPWEKPAAFPRHCPEPES